MIFKRFILLISFLVCILSNAQVVVKDWENQLLDSEFRILCLKARQVITSKNTDYRKIRRADIFPLDESWYLTMEGMFDVYKWQDQEWVNLYKPKFWGYNFGSLKFVNGGNLYSFGGNGFWKGHGEIIKFHTHANEWDIMHQTAKLPFGLGIPGSKELFILREDSISIFDYKNEQIKSFYYPIFSDSIPYFINRNVIESKNYSLSVSANQILLDKRNNSIHLMARGAFIFILDQYDGYYRVAGDSVLVYNKKFEFEMAELINADFQRYHQIYPGTSTMLSETNAGFKYYIIALVFILLGAGSYYFFIRKGIKSPEKEDFHELIDQVLHHAGSILSSDELDQILNIQSYLSPENSRYKRSKLVNEINDTYRIKHNTELITRIKDPNDKRKFFYRINSL